jgi:hypothetical protein
MADQVDPRVCGVKVSRGSEALDAPANDNHCAAEPTLVAAAIALADGQCATLTLRLDPAQHVRLRLACAMDRRSAQAIVSEAVDEYLKMIPGIERLLAEATAAGGDLAAAGTGFDL